MLGVCARRKVEGPLTAAAIEAGLNPQLMELVSENGVHGCTLAIKKLPEPKPRIWLKWRWQNRRARGGGAVFGGDPSDCAGSCGGVAGLVAATELASHGVEAC